MTFGIIDIRPAGNRTVVQAEGIAAQDFAFPHRADAFVVSVRTPAVVVLLAIVPEKVEGDATSISHCSYIALG